ncbi:HPP family protein [Priestia megaterium]|uniref:HPP family protein n=1 Tax=Priestia megaterium TaxID=1404 RepID=UPI00041A75EC|nr:HPP family protein [Priestia megaterium]MED3923772.1 HPP family protein [Priestia megaterium]PFE35745.1 HPP family protein [Priestia megaterium]
MEIEKNLSQRKKSFLSYLNSYTRKMKGELKEEPKINYRDAVVSSLGGLIAIIISSSIALALGYPMALAPIGATCVLVFGAHKGPLSQPRHVLGGHLLATVSALIIWSLFHRSLITIAIVLAFVLILMIVTKTVHPPAAASAIVAINSQAGWGYLGIIMICACVVVLISTVYNNLFQDRQYPRYWV